MRTCGYCINLDSEKGECKKGHKITKFAKLSGFSRPKTCTTHKKESAKKKRENTDKWLNDKLDEAWSKAVRKKGFCEYCGKQPPAVVLHAHHIFSRRHFSTRWEVKNGICLCTGCHLYIAHKDIQEFSDWVLERYGFSRIEALRIMSHRTKEFTKEDKRALLEKLRGHDDR